MPQRLFRLILGFLLIVLLAYPADWAVWRLRASLDHNGHGMGSVEVTRVTVASLKGNKVEYYADGTENVVCSHSVFRQAGDGACWWLQRHAQVFTEY